MMLSRVADAIYWMSRYLERAENIARFVDVNLQLLLDQTTSEQTQWEPLVSITGDERRFYQTFKSATRKNITEFLTFSSEYSNSIISCLTAARENARSIREVISSEYWQETNSFYLTVTNKNAREEAELRPHVFYEELRRHGCLCNGMCDFTMSHDEGWHFSQVGRLLERADKTSRLLDVKYFMLLPKPEDIGKPVDIIQWSAVLHSASAFEMHRKRYIEILPSNVVEFLVLDREYPRSIYFSLEKAEGSLKAISGSAPGVCANDAERKLGGLRAELSFMKIDEIIDQGLHEFLDKLQIRMNDIDDALRAEYFAVTTVPSKIDFQGSIQ